MPMYDWVDKKTGKHVVVMRHFSKYEEIPTPEEVPDLSAEDYAAADWERLIGVDIQVQRGWNWGGGKGHW
jgi:hypothetical protein